MWIKVLDASTWVNMKQITHFSVEADFRRSSTARYTAYVYFNASSHRQSQFLPTEFYPDQARIPVCRGSEEECEQFVRDKSFLQSAYEWLGYLVAGGVGAVLTLTFT